MKISVECNSNMLNDMLNDIIMKKALVCSYSYVNGRSGYAKAFFLLQMSKFMGTFARTLMSTYRSIRMNTPKISTLIHSTLIQGAEV